MRIKVIFKTEKLPILYRHRFMALIKKALKEADHEFQGTFHLKGDSQYLQTLYQIGIGLRTGQGFGMVEVV